MNHTTTATADDDLSLSIHTGTALSGLLSGRGPLSDQSAGATSSGPSRRPQRILVAGDDVTSLADLVDAVTGPRREVHSTACSDLALELALQLHFDLVVLHLDVPGAGGIEVSHCIRSCHELQQPTIVIISRPLDEDTWTKALHCGADLVLHEPSSILDTTRALSALLQ
jgi:DNA-binding response OmpR family regulator